MGMSHLTPLGFEGEEKKHLDQLLNAGFIETLTSEQAVASSSYQKERFKIEILP